jgi:nucleoside-diphosphate-sugar epimerase
VWGLKRHPGGLPPGVEPLAGDVTEPASLEAALATLPGAPDGVVYAVSAAGFSDAAYASAYVDGLGNVLGALERADRLPARFLFVSSTGVYGDAGGDWVDETTPPEPAGFSGRRLLEGERLLLERAGESLRPAVVRFGGIYGPGRTRLIDQVRSGEARCPDGPPVWTNRIHRDDCAGVLAHLLDLPDEDLATVYVGVDTEPAPRSEVLRWIARRLGVEEPPRVPADEAPSRRRGTKRCSSARLQATGYRFRFPTFREGYDDVIARTLGEA